jgi:hypothetical protein
VLEGVEGHWICGIFVDGNHPRRSCMACAQHLAEKARCCVSIPSWTQQKIERLALGIHGLVEVVPLLFILM